MESVLKLGDPGPLRDRLVAAVLAGDKTATSGLRALYEDEGLEIPVAGEKRQLLDSRDIPVATVELTDVRIMRMGEADMDLVRAEAGSFDTVAGYRERHEAFWASAIIPNLKNVPAPALDDDTEVVVIRFRVLPDLAASLGQA